MKTACFERDGVRLLECVSVSSRPDVALELVSACHEHDTNRVLVEARALPPEFFALETRFAGEFLQKLQNYHVRLAGVFPADGGYSQRFVEFLREARRGSGFRAFEARAEAEQWLALS